VEETDAFHTGRTLCELATDVTVTHLVNALLNSKKAKLDVEELRPAFGQSSRRLRTTQATTEFQVHFDDVNKRSVTDKTVERLERRLVHNRLHGAANLGCERPASLPRP
jgi:hypothetical protein